MSKQSIARGARLVIVVAAGFIACRGPEPPRARASSPQFVFKTQDKANQSGTGRIGMHGYGRFLEEGFTGSGAPLTAGLPARGGGPAAAPPGDEGARSLGPNQHIGTPHRTRAITVTMDDGTTAIYQPKPRHK